MYELYNGDCLEIMKQIPDKSIDMILCDLPYGTTACKWDVVIPFEPLWEQYNRIIKDNGAILLFGSQPFTTVLNYSNLKMYRYEWIWQKTAPAGFLNVKKKPFKSHEIVSVFYKKQPKYNPQMRDNIKTNIHVSTVKNASQKGENVYGLKSKIGEKKIKYDGGTYPIDVILFSNVKNQHTNNFHPTQKPVALLEYLIKTYTDENETVLDNCMGSGSTGVACLNTNRNFIGIELDKDFFEIAKKRIEDVERS